jgi:hypothetical protein
VERRQLFIAIAAAALILVGMSLPALQRNVIVDSDLGNLHLPLRHFYAESLAAGDDFDWFPFQFNGYYLHGEGQAVLYHPLNRLSYGLLPLDIAFNLELLRNYIFLLVGGYLLFRRYAIRRDASVFGATLFAFCAFNTMHFMHMNLVAEVAHLPFGLLFIDIALRGESRNVRAGAALALSLTTASQLFFGHPQTVWLCLVAEAFHALATARIASAWRRLPWLAFAQLLAPLIAAVQLLPQWESLQLSERARVDSQFAYALTLHPANLAQLVSPLLFSDRSVGSGAPDGTEYALYSGAALPVLVTWLWIRRRAWGAARAAIWTMFFGAVLSIFLALGSQGLVYRLFASIPVLDHFRAPARYLVLFQLAAAGLGALAYADLARVCAGEAIRVWRHLLPLLVPAGLAVAIPLFFHGVAAAPFADQVSSAPRLLAGSVLVLAAVTAVALAARGQRIALSLLVVLTAADLGGYALTHMRRTEPVSLERFIHRRHVPDWAVSYRLHWGPPALTMRGVRLVNGYAGLVPSRRLPTDRFALPERPSAALLNSLRVSNAGAFAAKPIEGRLSRFRMLSQASVTHDLARQMGSVDVSSTALVERPLGLVAGEPGRVLVLADRPGQIRLETSASTRQLLTVSESWHPGWRVRVDGRDASLERVYGDFMGCVTPAGVHEVVLSFEPESLRLGRRISRLGLVLLLPLYLAMLWPWSSLRRQTA